MNAEIRKNIAHAINHLNRNGILDENGTGWYHGKKSDFAKRHAKAISYFEKLLEEANESRR